MRKQGIDQGAQTAGGVPAGYKKTPLGIIPEDWTTPELRTILQERKRRNRDLSFGKEAVLSVSGEKGVTNQIALLGRSFAGVSVAEYHVVEHGDLVYTKSPLKANPYGIIKQNKGEAGIVSTLYAVYSCEDITLGAFLDYYFSDDRRLNNYLRPLVKRGAKNDMKINNDEVLRGIIALPSHPEVKRIVEFLSACDRVIEGKQKLLEAKKTRKRALMQLLLDPETWRGGKNKPVGDWKTISFEKSFDLLRNNTHSRSVMTSGDGVANIHYGDVLVKYGELLDVSADDVASLTVGTPPNGDFLREGDVVIADTAEDETCGKAVEIGKLGSRKAVAGLHTIACRPKAGLFAAGWLGFFLNSATYHRQLLPLMAGIKVLSLARSSLRTTKIGVPPIDEQRRIVTVLLDADREIDGLAREIEAWKQKRKALSQLLLSGKVRV